VAPSKHFVSRAFLLGFGHSILRVEVSMKRVCAFVVTAAVVMVGNLPEITNRVSAQAKPTGYADQLYVLDGGLGKAGDARSWLNMMVPPGTPIDISAYAHLIKHGNDWMMFDTSTNDIIATMPNGFGGATANAIRWVKTPAQTMTSQLKTVGITPDDIKYIGISHNHADHTGNISLFKKSTVLIQRREYEFITANGGAPQGPPSLQGAIFAREHPVSLLDGDYDVFGDGSVILFFTGGHTLGSQVALVRLRNTGYVLLTGDAVHLRSNFDTRRIPRVQAANEENHWLDTVPQAFDRIAALMSFYKAQLWVHHDVEDYKGRKMAPQFYD
jgi:glyoxylase-like metal-dependent hydrolase (beta-lactamase superfamily II)